MMEGVRVVRKPSVFLSLLRLRAGALRAHRSAIGMYWHARWSAILVLALAASGCSSPRGRVESQLQELQTRWQTNVAHQASLPAVELDWTSALARLKVNNLEMRHARNDVTNSQEAVRQIIRDLIPTLNLRSGVSKRLEDISGTTVDDVTFSADSFLNIPGLVSFGARYYAARLFQLRSEAGLALKERQKVIELYKLFLEADQTHAEAAHLENQRRTADAVREVDAFAGQLMFTELDLRQMSLERETETLQQRASELLGSHASRWILLTNGLPNLSYDHEPMPLTDTSRVARLHLLLMAIEFEAARAQLNGIKLRYWPELNIFVNAPPIYQRAFGKERFFDAAELRASADLFWYVDTRGHVTRQLRQAKRQHALQRDALREQSLSLIDRLVHTQTLMRAAREKAAQIDRNLAVLQAVPPAQNFYSLQKYAEDYRSLLEQQRQIRRELAELNTLFWFVDEGAWPPEHT